ncbi:hypothetical protein L243_36940, partial [Salmonella enterica subsp. enterica serovar Worthington str. BCH-3008]
HALIDLPACHLSHMREGGGREKSIAEVFELERLAQIAAAHQRHRCLQIVAGFTGHTH